MLIAVRYHTHSMVEEIISAEHSYFALLLRCIRIRMITYQAHILRTDAPLH